MFLESLTVKDSCFVTLTYSPEKLPVDGSLVPSHARDFLKRLRARVSPLKVRFFLVGEYGDRSGRPHYHAVLFGVGVQHRFVIEKAWSVDGISFGFVAVSEFEIERAQYTCGYILKKLTKFDDPRLRGRYPEFSRKSLKPGIGAPALELISERLSSGALFDDLERSGDVPRQLRFGKQSIPLGRYLRAKLREKVGFSDEWLETIKARFTMEKSAEVLALWQAALDGAKALTPREAVVRANLGRIRSVEFRASNRREGRSL